MEKNKIRFGKWLDLIMVMIDGRNHTAKELAEVLGTTARNFYYTLNVLREYGFIIIHDRTYYSLDARSPFFQMIADSVDFTETETIFLHGMLSAARDDDAQAARLKRKLERYYGIKMFASETFRHKILHVVNILERAIKMKKCVILHGYSSPHSRSVTDRVVEPFLFLGDKEDIRAYEIKTKTNKTFKISRIESVELVDTPWFNEAKHKQAYTDMFMFSGEDRYHVKLRLDRLAHHLMLEEYPHSLHSMTPAGTDYWIFETDLVSYVGITRFILGLYDNVKILEGEGLKEYIQIKIESLSSNLSPVREGDER